MHKYIARVDILVLDDGVETLLERASQVSETLRDVERAFFRAKESLRAGGPAIIS